MSYDRVKQARKLAIGTNQTLKSLENQVVKSVVLSKDADRQLITPIVSLCQQKGTPLVWVDSMKQLGKACGIAVAAAAVAIVEE
ncbi:MAG: ribosomal protein L7ae-like protein [Bacilli bacterium]|nr:ribosomal protein L7ae-like protein [Bacilli bacterium]